MTDLVPTPGQTVGPFFGYALPFDRDNELVPLSHPSAVRLHGRVTDGHGVGMEMPVWPMIVLRTPKGWTGPKVVDGKPVEGTWRAHQVPVTDFWGHPEHLKILEEWMKSYQT